MQNIFICFLFISIIATLVFIYFDGVVLFKQEGFVKNLIKLIINPDPEFGLDFSVSYSASGEKKARQQHGEQVQTEQSAGPACDTVVMLTRIDPQAAHPTLLPPGLLMLETSDRATLTPRQACAVESGARQSGMVVNLVMTSSYLDLSDNTTCHLYTSTSNNINFFSINVTTIAKDTPLEQFFRDGQLNKSAYKIVHTSDVLRLLLVYMYGGFYLDLDYVVIRDLSHYHNMLVEVGFSRANPTYKDIRIGNNAFAFNKGHPFTKLALTDISKGYEPKCWACIGRLMAASARKLANTSLIENIPTSAQLSITPMQRMLPVHYSRIVNTMWPEVPVPFKTWEKLFRNSSAIHFNSKMTSNLAVPDDPQYSSYALLGPRLCPVAYYSSRNF
eukprot:GFUD01028904.1.p1 GENE.GFUD01028904.1~~GFUD01028904.1.p1  ORF type:complete len:388 (-),score=75.77 GFUD01028904.1:90-1253(-)